MELTGAKLGPSATSMAWDCLHGLNTSLLLLTPSSVSTLEMGQKAVKSCTGIGKQWSRGIWLLGWMPDVDTKPSPAFHSCSPKGCSEAPQGVHLQSLLWEMGAKLARGQCWGCSQEVLHSLPEAAFGVICGGPAGRGVVEIPAVSGRIPGLAPLPTVIALNMGKL